MKDDNNDLNVRERILASLDAYRAESPGTPPSVAAICRSAGVSRASLYEHHRDLVRKIQSGSKPRGASAKASSSSATVLRQKLAAERRRSNALYIIYVELQAEIRRLRAHLEQAPSRERKRAAKDG